MDSGAFPSLWLIGLALATGIIVGIVFSLVKLPSPAPPFLGLLGLIGMFIGQRLLPMLHYFMTLRQR